MNVGRVESSPESRVILGPADKQKPFLTPWRTVWDTPPTLLRGDVVAQCRAPLWMRTTHRACPGSPRPRRHVKPGGRLGVSCFGCVIGGSAFLNWTLRAFESMSVKAIRKLCSWVSVADTTYSPFFASIEFVPPVCTASGMSP